MVNAYKGYPAYNSYEGVDDNFLDNPVYDEFLSFGSNPSFSSLTTPALTVPSSTTGLNFEALPTKSGATTSYLEISGIYIAEIPLINSNTAPVCTTQSYSINNTANWPISWSVSPATLASVSGSGNSGV
jgi:hypothetical protein